MLQLLNVAFWKRFGVCLTWFDMTLCTVVLADASNEFSQLLVPSFGQIANYKLLLLLAFLRGISCVFFFFAIGSSGCSQSLFAYVNKPLL